MAYAIGHLSRNRFTPLQPHNFEELRRVVDHRFPPQSTCSSLQGRTKSIGRAMET
jgi:hypothetical protein